MFAHRETKWRRTARPRHLILTQLHWFARLHHPLVGGDFGLGRRVAVLEPFWRTDLCQPRLSGRELTRPAGGDDQSGRGVPRVARRWLRRDGDLRGGHRHGARGDRQTGARAVIYPCRRRELRDSGEAMGHQVHPGDQRDLLDAIRNRRRQSDLLPQRGGGRDRAGYRCLARLPSSTDTKRRTAA